jgi:hypothetical protein
MAKKQFQLPTLERGKARVSDLDIGIHAVKWEWIDGGVRETKAGKCYPIPEQKVYAEELCGFLNRELKDERGDSWRVVWANPKKSYWDRLSGLFRPCVPQSLEVQYLDGDRDVQFVLDISEGAGRIVDIWMLLDNFSFTDVMQLCMGALKEYRELMYCAEVRYDQKYSPMRGEKDTAPEDFSVNQMI